MNLLPADYAVLGVTVVLSVLGLFRGFSGTLAFVLAFGAAAFAARFGWPETEVLTDVIWMRAGVALVGTLLVFGLVRLVVKKTVNGILAQPTDAIFGFLLGAAVGLLILVIWAWSGLYLDYSSLATEAARYVR